MKEIYKLKGYSDEWIEKRARGIAIRDELTDEWDKRGIRSKKDYSILTAEISRATFGLTPSEYKRLKGLKEENLEDHMDDIELILTMLGEATTTRLPVTGIPGYSLRCEKMPKMVEMWQVQREKILRENWERLLFQAIIILKHPKEPKELGKNKRHFTHSAPSLSRIMLTDASSRCPTSRTRDAFMKICNVYQAS